MSTSLGGSSRIVQPTGCLACEHYRGLGGGESGMLSTCADGRPVFDKSCPKYPQDDDPGRFDYCTDYGAGSAWWRLD